VPINGDITFEKKAVLLYNSTGQTISYFPPVRHVGQAGCAIDLGVCPCRESRSG